MTVSRPAWLDGTFDDAMRMVAQRAVISREMGGLVKRADILGSIGDVASGAGNYLGDAASKANETFSGLVPNDHLRHGLMGLGIGGGLGALGGMFGKKKKKGILGSALTGALLGGALGGGGSMLYSSLPKGGDDTPAGPAKLTPDKEKALGGLQNARQELGLLGASPDSMNQIMEQYKGGQLDEAAARKQLAGLVPGVGEQIASVPDAVASAFGQNRYGEIPAQLDIAGLKNITPYSGHFDPTTAAAAVGLNVAARNVGNVPGMYRGAVTGLGNTATYTGDKLKDLANMAGRGRVGKTIGTAAKGIGGFGEAIADRAHTRDMAEVKNMLDKTTWRGSESMAFGGRKDLQAALDSAGTRGYTMTPQGDLKTTVKGKSGWKPVTVSAKELKNVMRAVQRNQPKVQNPWTTWDYAAKKPGLIRNKLTGGPVPLLASMLPLLYKEWSGGGYRTGEPAINELMASQQQLQGD